MNKTLKQLGILAVSIAAVSCGKDTAFAPKPLPGEVTEPETVAQLDPEKYLVSFGAHVESASTKVSVSLTTGALALEDGDEALVVSGGVSGTYVFNLEKALFEPKTVADAVELSGASEAHVYYPAGEFSYSAGVVTFTMPEAIGAGSAADLGDKLPLCGTIPASASPIASFKNLGSVLHVRFNAPMADGETITGVELSGSGVNITGSGTVSWADTDDQIEGLEPVLANLSGEKAGTSLTIDCKDAPKHLTSAEYQDFFFFLPQQGSFESMQIKAIYGKTVGAEAYTPFELVSRKSAMTLSRGKLVKVEKTLAGHFSGGDGSSAYPYLIASCSDFKSLSTRGNVATRNFFRSAGANYLQTEDLDFEEADLSSFTIAVTGSTGEADSFKGIYNGNGHKISRFTISLPETNAVALFPNMQGEVKNLTLEDITVEGKQNTGGIVGWLNGKVTNCEISGTSSVHGANATGGIAANIRNASVVYGCTNRATVTSSGSNTGGVVGYIANSGKLELCSNYGDVSGVSEYGVGGILGACNESGAKVLGCQNYGDVTGTKANTGGLVGRAPSGLEINASSSVVSRNEGTVTGVNSTGGIIGQLGGGSIACTTNAGEVHGTYDVGGIIGLKSNGGIWSRVFNQGAVTAQYNVGGLVGTQEAGGIAGNVLSNGENYVRNEGVVTVTGKTGNLSYAGGLIGRMKGGYLGDPSVKKTVENTGNVVGTGSGQAVGGMVGYMEAGTVSHCSSSATVINDQKCVGGAIGWLTGGKVYNSYAKGIVKGAGQVGGFVGYILASNDCYLVNCLAGAERVVATNKASNDGVGGFVGYMNQNSASHSDKKVVIANCAVWDGIIKAPNEDNGASNKIRVGGFVGVENAQSGGSANVMIQNSYYQGLPSHVGCGGGVDDNTLPTVGPDGNGVVGGFVGYSGATIRDCYCDNAGNSNNKFVGSGQPVSATSGNYSRLRTNIMYGKAKVSWILTLADKTEVNANTAYLGDVLNTVAATVGSQGSIALSTWDSYSDGDNKYYYPSVLTSMGENFYRK